MDWKKLITVQPGEDGRLILASSSQLPPVKLSFSRRHLEKIKKMALQFGPQWLRNLSDGGANSPQPGAPNMSVKFKLAEYRYGREEMLSLFQETSPPPDQVRKHLSIFSTEIQKPITMSTLTEDEQRLISQGFNSTVVLRAAGRSSGPPLRASRGGGMADRSRGRGRGRGEGYNLRSENGDVGYSRQTQDGWEHVGRKFERSYSRGYDESGTTKREFSRSSSDNWRDKRHDDEDDDEGGVTWRNNRDANQRWSALPRSNWREPQNVLGFDGERRPLPPRRGFDQDAQVARRRSESYDNEGEVPEWVEDDVGDDPGTFDSSGAFVSTKEGRKSSDTRTDTTNIEGSEKKTGNQHPTPVPDNTVTSEPHSNNTGDKVPLTQAPKPPYSLTNVRNGTGDVVDCRSHDQSQSQLASLKGQPDSFSVISVSNNAGSSSKDGDIGFSLPNKKDEETNGKSSPTEHYTDTSTSTQLQSSATVQKPEQVTRPRLTNPEFLHMEKSLQNLVASMTADHRDRRQLDVSQGALPLTHEHSNKWFYKDPQGEIQGPFNNEEMSQWFSAGFFTMSLLIKRGCDDSFKQLGELIKRYNRVPFLPGPPLPPLITSISPEPVVIPSSPLTIPSFVPSTPAAPLVGPGLPSVPDPLILQHMLLQQEYLKQTFLMRQMQIQTLHQMQEQDSFKSLSPEQQQHLSMQMMAQTNPVFMQHFQQLQQQQLLLQQEQQKAAAPTATGEGPTAPFSQPPSSSNTATPAPLAANNTPTPDKPTEDSLAWASLQQYLVPGVWSQATAQQVVPPTSLWDIDTGNGTLTPAYLAQLDKMKREKKEEKLKEEERLRQDALEKKQEEIMRQQEELERQKAQMRREMEELERQKQIELLKIEEARRQEEERIRQELEQQQQDKLAEERRRAEEDKRRLEEEGRREQELRKQEEKKRKEEDKRRQQEEHKRQAELKRKKEEELQQQREQQQQQRELELQRQQEWQRQQLEALRLQEEEEARVQREAAERERSEAHKRQQELQRQLETQRRLQQAQRDQLANIQLPATTNWAAQLHNLQASPTQSRSLTDIQEEEARKEQEREREQQQQQALRLQEQVLLKQQLQLQQKSWATHMSQGAPTKGVSLLDIQHQEQESANKSQKEKPSTQTYQAKVALSLASPSTWAGSTSGGTWSSQSVWSSSYSNTTPAIWDQVSNQPARKSAVKESGEFPALKNQAQQTKKNSDKSGKTKVSGAKQKKEEESVQKLFQTRQQDDFSHWVTEHVSSFCAPIDVPTFVSFIVEVDSPDDVREYMKTYLGDTKESRDFARQFVEKRNYFRNQARLEKQQEEDSIWGPAPAINPHSQMRVGSGGGNNSNSANDGGEGGTGKAKNRKKKQKMQKLDGSILGFTVHADPNRKNAAGEVESIQ